MRPPLIASSPAQIASLIRIGCLLGHGDGDVSSVTLLPVTGERDHVECDQAHVADPSLGTDGQALVGADRRPPDAFALTGLTAEETISNYDVVSLF